MFTSTAGTLAINDHRPVTEDDPHNWSQGGAYIDARVLAENLVLQYARDEALPAVALCISTTYGPGDWSWRLAADTARLPHRPGCRGPVPVPSSRINT